MPDDHLPADGLMAGRAVPARLIAPLRDAAPLLPDSAALQARLAEDGYLLLRGLIPQEAVAAARAAVFRRLHAVGEVRDPAEAGRHSGRSRRRESVADLGAFWKSVSDEPALRRVTNGPVLGAAMRAVFGVPAVGFDYLFLRPAPGGRYTGVHCDAGFFTRATERVLTCWIALSDVPMARGPLFLVEGSHRWADIAAANRGFDVHRDTHRRAALDSHPADLAEQRGTRLLTADFRAGDVLCFGMFTLHGAFQHTGADDRLRLSCDVRYQPAADPRDPRYFGPAPTGTTGAGYGELNGAKPLTEEWHVR